MRLSLIVLFTAAAGFAQPPRPDTTELERELKRLTDVYAIVEQNAAEAASPDVLIYQGAIPGMLARLDPHSVFFDSDQFEQLKEMEKSVAKGFGSIVSVLPGRVLVLQVQADSPAAKAGLAPGDEILVVNNISLQGLDPDQLVQLLGLARQNKVEVRVRRPGSAFLLTLTMAPAELQSPSVDRAFLLQPGIGYVRATSFETNTGKEIHEAVEKLGGRSLRGLVLDLRDNPGGVLTAALDTASLFLQPGQKILSARGRGSKGTDDVSVPQEAKPYTFPLAVLVDGKTASASEIVAGAMQDHDRAKILGEPTFGKGLVQSVFPLSEGTGLALTVAFYYTPSGRSIQRPLHGGELSASAQTGERPAYQTDSGRTVRGGGGIDPDEVVLPEAPTPFRIAMEASASFNAYALEWLAKHKGEARPGMEITPAMLDDFQLFLSRRNIRPSLREWTADRERTASRLKQEILNLAVSVAAGDEVEMQRDPVVRRALSVLEAR
jgi:carboxyl-terminal processing protease